MKWSMEINSSEIYNKKQKKKEKKLFFIVSIVVVCCVFLRYFVCLLAKPSKNNKMWQQWMAYKSSDKVNYQAQWS